MSFCKECGSRLNEDAFFCGECGTPVDRGDAATQLLQANDNQTVQQQPNLRQQRSRAGMSNQSSPSGQPPRKKMSKVQKIVGSVIVALAVLLFGAYKFGENLTSAKNAVENLQEAFKAEDKEALSELLYSSDKSLKIDDKTVEGLLAYIEDNPSYLTDLIDSLNEQAKELEEGKNTGKKATALLDNGSDTVLSLKQVGKTAFIYPKYQFEVTPYYLNIGTNYYGATIYLNGEEIHTLGEDEQEVEHGPLLPGIYTVKAVYEGEYTTIEAEEEIELFGDYEYEDVYLDLEGNYIFVESNYDDATLYINGEDTGSFVNDLGEIGPVPADGTMEVYAEKEFPWGTAQSEMMTVSNDLYYYELYLDPLNQEVMDQVMEVINNHELQWTKVVSELDPSYYTNVSPEYLAGLEEQVESLVSYEEMFVGDGLIRSIFDLDSFYLYEDEGNMYMSVTVDTVFKGEYVPLSIPEDELDELLQNLEESHNMWNYELVFNPDDSQWYIVDSYSMYTYEPENSQTFEF